VEEGVAQTERTAQAALPAWDALATRARHKLNR
jgi:hypothetical protein